MYDQSKLSELIRFARVDAGSIVIDVYPGDGDWKRRDDGTLERRERWIIERRRPAARFTLIDNSPDAVGGDDDASVDEPGRNGLSRPWCR
jgi:hypothetical protein